MKQRTLKAVAVSAVLLLVAVVSVAVLRPANPSRQKNRPVPVKVAAVELNTASSEARYSATIIPRTEVELAFKVGGYVDALQQVRGVDGEMRDLQEGDRITAGAVLARVRQSDYQVKVKEAESQASEAKSGIDASKAQYQEALSGIASSKAQLAEAEAAYEKAKLDFDRAQNLFASQSMTKANYDAAKAQYDMTSRQGRRRPLAGSGDPGQSRFRKSTDRRRRGEVKRRAGGRAGDTRFPYRTLHSGRRSMGSCWKNRSRKERWSLPATTGFVVADTSSVKAVFGVADVAVAEMKLGRTLSVESESMPGKEFQRTDHLRLSGRRPQEPSHSTSR